MCLGFITKIYKYLNMGINTNDLMACLNYQNTIGYNWIVIISIN